METIPVPRVIDQVKSHFEVADEASQSALEHAGLHEITVDELPFALTGLRSVYARVRVNRLDAKLGVEEVPRSPEEIEDLDRSRLEHFNAELEQRADSKAKEKYEKKLGALHIPAPPESKDQGTPKEAWVDPDFEFDEADIPHATSIEDMLMVSIENGTPFVHRDDVERLNDFNSRLIEKLRDMGADDETMETNQAHTVKGAWELAKQYDVPYVTTGKVDERLDRFNQALQEDILAKAKVDRNNHAARGTLEEFAFDESTIQRASTIKEMWNLAAAYKIHYATAYGTNPHNRKEWRRAQRARRRQELLQTETSALRALENGVYFIDPETGKSSERKLDPDLKGLSFFDRRKAKAEEGRYTDALEETEHLKHKLGVGHGHHEHPSKKEKRQKNARDKHKKTLHRAELAKELKPIRTAARRVYRAEVQHSRARRHLDDIGHRIEFSEELADVLLRDSVGRNERMTIKRRPVGRGGLSQGISRARGSWHKNLLNDRGHRGLADPAQARKKKMERLSEQHSAHVSLTSRKNSASNKVGRKAQNTRDQRQILRQNTDSFVAKRS